MHSPQCIPLVWTAQVIPAPQQGEQVVVLANAVDQGVGTFDTSNAFAYSGIRARFRFQAEGDKPVFLYSNPNQSLTVIVPWRECRVFVTELSGLPGYSWVVTMQKLEAENA